MKLDKHSIFLIITEGLPCSKSLFLEPRISLRFLPIKKKKENKIKWAFSFSDFNKLFLQNANIHIDTELLLSITGVYSSLVESIKFE